MGQHFGDLMKTRHIVSYYLSPFEQRLYPSYSFKMLNSWRRIRSSVFRVVPSFVIGYLIYSWANDYYKRLQKKNPADYANDQ